MAITAPSALAPSLEIPRAAHRPAAIAAPTRRRVAMLLADGLAVGLALLATRASFGVAAGPQGLSVAAEASAAGLAGLLWVLWVRRAVHGDRPLDALPQLAQAAVAFGFVLYAALTLTGGFALRLDGLLVLVTVLAAGTAGLRAAAHRLAWTGTNRERVIILGGDEVGCSIAHRAASGHVDLDVLGIVDERPPADASGPAWLGSIGELQSIVADLRADRVVVAFADAEVDGLPAAVAAVREQGVRVDIVPRLHEILPAGATAETLAGVPVIALPAQRLPTGARAAKRTLDVVVSGTLLVLLSPLLLAIAVAIRLDSRGTVLFRQDRIGRGGRTFRVSKFRSMGMDADARKAEVAHLNGHAERNDARMFKAAGDPRITRVGSILRTTSLDELPQLLDVLRGDMSLVGPRPLVPEEDVHVTGRARNRCALRPGITGLWQVSGRSDLSFAEMLILDEQYVAGWSLWRDVKLLLRTLPVMAFRRGAY